MGGLFIPICLSSSLYPYPFVLILWTLSLYPYLFISIPLFLYIYLFPFIPMLLSSSLFLYSNLFIPILYFASLFTYQCIPISSLLFLYFYHYLCILIPLPLYPFIIITKPPDLSNTKQSLVLLCPSVCEFQTHWAAYAAKNTKSELILERYHEKGISPQKWRWPKEWMI